VRLGFDISDPGTTHLTGYDVAGGYLGGMTPHEWSPAQWAAQGARWRAPFWTPDPGSDPKAQAADIVDLMRELKAPAWSIVWLDMETTINPGLVNGIANEVVAGGFLTGVYGSESTVFANPPRSGYMVALWDGVVSLYEHPHAIAKQYRGNVTDKSGLQVDLDIYADACPLWDTRPAAPPVLPPWAQQSVADLNQIATTALTIRTDIIANVR
jgi:hypothetical protein